MEKHNYDHTSDITNVLILDLRKGFLFKLGHINCMSYRVNQYTTSFSCWDSTLHLTWAASGPSGATVC